MFSTIFPIIVIFQLFFFGIMRYFFMIPTGSMRWLIDGSLYMLLMLVLLSSKLKIDKVFILYIFLFLVNIFSFLINSNELVPLIKQVRFTFLGGMIYLLLMHVKLSKEYFEKLINLLFYTGYLQLPICIIQLLTYDYFAAKGIFGFPVYVDCASGSIGYSETGVLGMFLVILSIVKLQYGLEYGFTLKSFLQLVILLAPLGLINSDAQFVFVPIIFLSMIIINKKITKNTLKYFTVLIIVFVSINQLVTYNWKSQRTIGGYIKGVFQDKTFIKPTYTHPGRLLRNESMLYVWEQDTKNPNFSSIIGKGPGYWIERDSEGKEKSITNVWYHCNTILLTYGELGLIGLFVVLMIPLAFFIETDNSFWGKVVKLQAIYLFLGLFYEFPLSSMSITIPLMIFLVYFRKFNCKTKTYKVV